MEDSLVDVVTNATSSISESAKSVYDGIFREFKLQSYIVNDDLCKISDSEMERALTGIPESLFKIGEKISNITLERDVLKRQIKTVESSLKKFPADSDTSNIEHDLETLYCTLKTHEYMISRATAEVAAAKEYLMSVKKIWDRRREVEKSVPIAEKDYTLPDYVFKGKQYITGQQEK